MKINPDKSNEDRRDVPAREFKGSKVLAHRLAQTNISANMISVFGVIAAILASLAFLATPETTELTRRILWISAGLFIGLRLLCNMLDGMVAVEWGKSSPVGALYNEIPDRLSDFIILLGAGYSLGGNVNLGFLAAFTAVFTAYVRVAAKSVGAPSDFGGPMAKPQRMAILILCTAYLGFTPESWHFVWGESNFGLISVALGLITLGSIVTAFLRIRRAAYYLNTHPVQ
ncbi:MAG: CDP-alcohol phosphatidyltransferase family protein [Methylomicrobium sp.]|nr:CDP-alcohol phosphatidyltransferase family protein [Methylomicrobium sp.]